MNYLDLQAVSPGFLEWLRKWRNPTNSVLNKVLIMSVKLGHSNVLQLLLQKEAVDVNAKSVSGLTPLHLATMAQQMDMVEWLANNGADGNAKAANTVTPIAIALKDDRMDMVKTMWNAAYSKLEDLEKDTEGPILSKLKEVFAGKELHIADTVFQFIRPKNFEDLMLGNEDRDSAIELFKSYYDDLQKYVKMLGKVKQQLQRGTKRKLLKPLPASETPAKVAKK